MVIISVKKGVADMRRQLLKAVIVRQKRPFRRSDGTMVQFEDNAAVGTAPRATARVTTIDDPTIDWMIQRIIDRASAQRPYRDQ